MHVEHHAKPFRDQDLLDAVQSAIDRDRAARLGTIHEMSARRDHPFVKVNCAATDSASRK